MTADKFTGTLPSQLPTLLADRPIAKTFPSMRYSLKNNIFAVLKPSVYFSQIDWEKMKNITNSRLLVNIYTLIIKIKIYRMFY